MQDIHQKSYYILNEKEASAAYVFLLSILSFLSCTLFPLDVILPVGLLYGPLLYCFTKEKSLKEFAYHALPYVLFIGIYLGILMKANPFSVDSFLIDYYTCTGVSLFTYSVLTLYSIANLDSKGSAQRRLSCMLSIIFLIGSLFVYILLFNQISSIKLGFSPSAFLLVLFLTTLFLCIHFLYFRRKISSGKALEEEIVIVPTANRPTFDSQTLIDYHERIAHFRNSGHYLKSCLTLEDLSSELGIPKHHLSHYLNNHLGKKFYEFLAEDRIAFAIEQLRTNNTLTIEALAHSCGYNSKTSFLKHFRAITGMLPSQYLDELQKKAVEC